MYAFVFIYILLLVLFNGCFFPPPLFDITLFLSHFLLSCVLFVIIFICSISVTSSTSTSRFSFVCLQQLTFPYSMLLIGTLHVLRNIMLQLCTKASAIFNLPTPQKTDMHMCNRSGIPLPC